MKRRSHLPAAWEDPPDARGTSFSAPTATPVVKALLIANVALFVLQSFVLPEALIAWLALSPLHWLEGFPWLPLWQLVSYGFLHDNPMHLLGNMLFLYFLGTMLEQEIGPRRFLVFYSVSIVLAGACQLVLGLGLGQQTSIIGASGGVLAIVCAVATLRPTTRVILIIVPLTLKTVALLYVGLDLFNVLMQLKGAVSNVASFAHLSGALFGFLAVRRGWIWRDPMAAVEDWRERKAVDRRASDEEKLDELLAKINREGIHALSSGERAFLKRLSRH